MTGQDTKTSFSMVPDVRQVIADRLAGRTMRGRRQDPYHVALVVEGGGMRGVVGSAMAAALEERGLLPCFDTIHASSAGACAGAYFAAGNVGLGTRIYYEDINNKKFIDPWRALRGAPIMNTRFLIYGVMRHIKLLNVGRILEQDGFLHIVTTHARTGRGKVFNSFADEAHFLKVLQATITIPLIGGPAVSIDGVDYVDGGMVQQIALESALTCGATHVLVLLTRRRDELERTRAVGSMSIDSVLLRMRYGRMLSNVYSGRSEQISRTLEIIQARQDRPGTLIEGLMRSANATQIGRLTIDGHALRAASCEAHHVVDDYFAR